MKPPKPITSISDATLRDRLWNAKRLVATEVVGRPCSNPLKMTLGEIRAWSLYDSLRAEYHRRNPAPPHLGEM